MICSGCRQSIRPGLEITVDAVEIKRTHCPYCLCIVTPQATSSRVADESLSSRRHEQRKKIRGQFADRLIEASADGKIRCPSCVQRLDETDVRLLRENEYFRCHRCGHDLATVAYQEEAYHQQRWQPVVAALGELYEEQKCTNCCYLGAIAKKCQSAFSCLPTVGSKPTRLLTSMMRRSDWITPDCEWESCFGVKQYRKIAGEGLQVL